MWDEHSKSFETTPSLKIFSGIFTESLPMEEPEDTSAGNKWWGRLTIAFVVLFALLWSLGSFFFWLLLGLALAFGFLTLYYSDVRIRLFNPPRKPENPYRAFIQRPANTETSQNQVFGMGKIARAFIIIVGSMIAMLMIAGIFSSKNEEPSTGTTEVELTEPPGTDDATLYTDKGNIFFSDSQYDSALKYYDKVLAINPENQYALYNKALVFYMKKDFWGSIRLVKKSLRQQPDYKEALWLLGDNFYSVSNYDSAIITLEMAHKNDYNDPGFLQLLGDSYLKKGNRTKAAEVYKEVLEQDSSKFEVYRQLAELEPSRAAWYRKKADAIEQSIK